MSGSIRTLIIDDEPLNRDEMRYLLSQHSDVDIVGEADGIDSGRAAIARHRPDLVLLDIRMDSATGGLELAAWMARHAPETYLVFVTAHPEHALAAYDHHPAHFLVKPVNDLKLAEALAWLRRRGAGRPQGGPGRIAVRYQEPGRAGDVLRPTAYLRPEDILYIRKNKGNSTVDVVLGDGECLRAVRQPLEHFETLLGDDVFFRIHSGVLVNLHHPWRLKPRPGEQDSYHLALRGGVELPVSRLRLGRLREVLQAPRPRSDAQRPFGG